MFSIKWTALKLHNDYISHVLLLSIFVTFSFLSFYSFLADSIFLSLFLNIILGIQYLVYLVYISVLKVIYKYNLPCCEVIKNN